MPENFETKTTRRITPEAFAAWLHAQGEEPSVHVLNWFAARGVVWPVVKAQDAPAQVTTIAELAQALKGHPKGKSWPAEWVQMVRLEFQRRGGWKREVPGDSYTRDSKIQSLLAEELGRSRQALDRILKDGPPPAGALAFDRLAQSAGARRSA